MRARGNPIERARGGASHGVESSLSGPRLVAPCQTAAVEAGVTCVRGAAVLVGPSRRVSRGEGRG